MHEQQDRRVRHLDAVEVGVDEVHQAAAHGIQGHLLAADPTVDLPLANKALGISRAHGYALAKRGEYPVKVLKLGCSYRVITADLLNVLGITSTQA